MSAAESKVEGDEPEMRLAGPGDAARIASVLSASFSEYKASYTPGGYAATVLDAGEIGGRFGEGPVWVASLAGEVVGTVSVVDRGDALYVRSMAVVPAARGRRVGESLLRRVESYARERGRARLVLSTTPFLRRAIRLYEKFGFKRNGDGPHELAGTPLFTMEKILPRPEA